MSHTLPPDFINLEQTGRPSPDSQHEHFTRQQLERYQARALQLCREYAYAHSPFYLGRVISWLDPEAQSRPCIISSTSSFHMSAYIQKSTAQRNPGGLRLSPGDPLDATVQRLNEWQPAAILGYPPFVRVLADEQFKGRLHIAPRAVACVSEYMPEETQRRVVYKSFTVPVCSTMEVIDTAMRQNPLPPREASRENRPDFLGEQHQHKSRLQWWYRISLFPEPPATASLEQCDTGNFSNSDSDADNSRVYALGKWYFSLFEAC